MARDDGVAAHAARLVAHAAYSHRFAGRACVQAGGIRRARHGAYAFEALFGVFDDLIHAHEHNNVLRAKREACHAVGVAVDVHELAFERKRIADRRLAALRAWLLSRGRAWCRRPLRAFPSRRFP